MSLDLGAKSTYSNGQTLPLRSISFPPRHLQRLPTENIAVPQTHSSAPTTTKLVLIWITKDRSRWSLLLANSGSRTLEWRREPEVVWEWGFHRLMFDSKRERERGIYVCVLVWWIEENGWHCFNVCFLFFQQITFMEL